MFWPKLDPLMQKSKADYTMFFRQLAAVAELPSDATDDELIEPLVDVFYQPLAHSVRQELISWLKDWKAAVQKDSGKGEGGMASVAARMKAVNPKYIPREWMLVEVGSHSLLSRTHVVVSVARDGGQATPMFPATQSRMLPNEA